LHRPGSARRRRPREDLRSQRRKVPAATVTTHCGGKRQKRHRTLPAAAGGDRQRAVAHQFETHFYAEDLEPLRHNLAEQQSEHVDRDFSAGR